MSEPTREPELDGFTVEWDPLRQQWMARSPSGQYTIWGHTQNELIDRRWELYARVLDHYRAAIAEVFPLRKQ